MIEFRNGGSLQGGGADAVAVGVFGDRVWGPGAEEVLGESDFTAFLDAKEFTGAAGQVVIVPSTGPFSLVFLVGLGDNLDHEGLRRAGGSLGRATQGLASVATTLHLVDLDEAGGVVAEGFSLGSYTFDRYKAEQKTSDLALVFLDTEVPQAELDRAVIISDAVILARDLVNEPALDLSPESFTDLAIRMSDELGLESDLWIGDEVAAEGFGGLVGVNAGADRPARMLRLKYRHPDAHTTLALVGKGILFDSGGLSIKGEENMRAGKADMGGAAAVLAGVGAVAMLGLAVNIDAIMPLTENLSGGSATRPGDVLRARNGTTMEVLNTDAEGRLVLADGLSLAAESEPDLIVDFATLTGACKVALGPTLAGIFSNDEGVAEYLVNSAITAGERAWHMPMPQELRADIDSDIADLKNVGSTRYGGAITAALFLQEFVGDHKWGHFDIAGPSWAISEAHYQRKGATGYGVRTIVAICEGIVG
jgi:leucyl aminopeptidase